MRNKFQTIEPFVDPFHADVLFLYPLKTSDLCFFFTFSGSIEMTVRLKRVKEFLHLKSETVILSLSGSLYFELLSLLRYVIVR